MTTDQGWRELITHAEQVLYTLRSGYARWKTDEERRACIGCGHRDREVEVQYSPGDCLGEG